MYVYLKMDGQFDNYESIGVGRFECNLKLDMPKEVFEEKLMNQKTIIIDNHVLKIDKLEKAEYRDERFSQKTSYVLPLGASVKKKSFLQKLKTLYFG